MGSSPEYLLVWQAATRARERIQAEGVPEDADLEELVADSVEVAQATAILRRRKPPVQERHRSEAQAWSDQLLAE